MKDTDLDTLLRKPVGREELAAAQEQRRQARKALLEQIVALPGGPERKALEDRLAFGDAFGEMMDAGLSLLNSAELLHETAQRFIALNEERGKDVKDATAEIIKVYSKFAMQLLRT